MILFNGAPPDPFEELSGAYFENIWPIKYIYVVFIIIITNAGFQRKFIGELTGFNKKRLSRVSGTKFNFVMYLCIFYAVIENLAN